MLKKILFLIILGAITTMVNGQDETNADEKATVYFVRASSLGAVINFALFDGEQVIGRINGMKYMRYECDPGKHLFWARSENKSFVEAELEPGKTYLIDVIPQMGGIKAGVALMPVDKSNYKLKRIQKLVSKKEPVSFDANELAKLQSKFTDVIERGMSRYEKRKAKDGTIRILSSDMTIDHQDLVFLKKSKKS